MINKKNALIIGIQVPVAIVLIVLYFIRNIDSAIIGPANVVDIYPFGGATFVVTILVGFVLAVVHIYKGFTLQYVVEKTRNFYIGLLVINTVIIIDFIVRGIRFADFTNLIIAGLVALGYILFLVLYGKALKNG
jgi:hypothetical protein